MEISLALSLSLSLSLWIDRQTHRQTESQPASQPASRMGMSHSGEHLKRTGYGKASTLFLKLNSKERGQWDKCEGGVLDKVGFACKSRGCVEGGGGGGAVGCW